MEHPQTQAQREAIAASLSQLALGAAFDRDEADILAGFLQETAFPAGTVITQEGRRANSLAFIEDGLATIRKADPDAPERHSIELARNALIGEIAFFDNQPRSATVVATTDVRLLVMTREDFDALAAAHPPLAIKLLFFVGRILSRRLRQVTGRFVGLLA